MTERVSHSDRTYSERKKNAKRTEAHRRSEASHPIVFEGALYVISQNRPVYMQSQSARGIWRSIEGKHHLLLFYATIQCLCAGENLDFRSLPMHQRISRHANRLPGQDSDQIYPTWQESRLCTRPHNLRERSKQL